MIVAGLQIDMHTGVKEHETARVVEQPRNHREHLGGICASHSPHVHRELADSERNESHLTNLLVLQGLASLVIWPCRLRWLPADDPSRVQLDGEPETVRLTSARSATQGLSGAGTRNLCCDERTQ